MKILRAIADDVRGGQITLFERYPITDDILEQSKIEARAEIRSWMDDQRFSNFKIVLYNGDVPEGEIFPQVAEVVEQWAIE